MEFINRKKELELLEKYNNLSKKKLFITAIYGSRRVGKTRLVKEFIKNKNTLYFFTYESKSSEELLKEYVRVLKEGNILSELENIEDWVGFFKVIFERCKKKVVVFDEFQNFWKVDKSIFSILQKFYDENEDSPLHIIILGSYIGLFKKIFQNKKQPLYGRIKAKIRLHPLFFSSVLYMLKKLDYTDIEQKLKIYFIFGGFPKYFVAIEDFDLKNYKRILLIENLFIKENAPLENEVEELLKLVFGKRSSKYYTILTAIANGKNKLNEIAAYVGAKESSLTRQLNELEHGFELIEKHNPIFGKKISRYKIVHPLIKFWFKFIYTKYSSYKLRDSTEIIKDISSNIGGFDGRRFEEVCKEYIISNIHLMPFKPELIGNWWGNIRENDERKSIEIDIVGANEKTSQIIFIECKWKNNVDPNSILQELRKKAKYIMWKNKNRKEYYCIFAKSFKTKKKIKNVILIDINDIISTYKKIIN